MARLAPLALAALALLFAPACVDDAGDLGDASLPADSGPRADAGPTDALPPHWFDTLPLDSGDLDAGPADRFVPRDSGPFPHDAGSECTPGAALTCACGDGVGSQACRSDGTLGCCQCPEASERETLACLQQGVVGRWEGTITTPWREPYRIFLHLFEDGTYGAGCTELDACTAFYYGSDGIRGGRAYELFDVRANGTGTGRLRVVWSGDSAQWGDLDGVRLSTDEERLEFDLWNTWSRDGRLGPISADLRRQP